jgi:tetratricopeptide (TPR) repeat protein
MREPKYRFIGGNFVWGEDWKDYLRRKPFTRDIYEMQRESTSEIVQAISDQTRKLLVGCQAPTLQIVQDCNQAIPDVLDIFKEVLASRQAAESHEDVVLMASLVNSLDLITGSFGRGIDQISSDLNSISDGIAELNSTFQWGFGEMLFSLSEIKKTVLEINKSLRTPLQTRAAEKYEIAKGEFERGHYPEALRYVNKAIKDYDLEWRFYALRGIIRLGTVHSEIRLVNPASAERAFLKAARYSPESTASARFMLQAGWSAFVQHKIDEAVSHTTEAVRLDQNLSQGWFHLAKFLMVKGQVDGGISALEKAIDLDVGYILKSDTDTDFDRGRAEVQNLFEAKRQQVISRIPTCCSDPEVPRPENDMLQKLGLLELLRLEGSYKAACLEAARRRQVEKKRLLKEKKERERAERERKERERKESEQEEERQSRMAILEASKPRSEAEERYFAEVKNALEGCEGGNKESFATMWGFLNNMQFRNSDEWYGIQRRFGICLDNFRKLTEGR